MAIPTCGLADERGCCPRGHKNVGTTTMSSGMPTNSRQKDRSFIRGLSAPPGYRRPVSSPASTSTLATTSPLHHLTTCPQARLLIIHVASLLHRGGTRSRESHGSCPWALLRADES